jgi:hypothetical protein
LEKPTAQYLPLLKTDQGQTRRFSKTFGKFKNFLAPNG